MGSSASGRTSTPQIGSPIDGDGPTLSPIMKIPPRFASDHVHVTRRYFLRLGTSGAAALGTMPLWKLSADEISSDPALAKPLGDLEYLTKQDEFQTVERGDPLPYTLPLEKRREVGLEQEQWELEVLADPESNSKIESPLSRETGTALTWDGLMKLAEKHAVRFLKVMTCNNINTPLGVGLWEGVPLREVVWLAKPEANVRRLYYHGYHNDDPKQMFRSSLSIGRVLEDPPGENPVILCYKLNGEWLSGKRGGPVRMLVPEAYGFKSVKWLQRVFLTNNHQANDTYANQNNDIDSRMKTFARFIHVSESVGAGKLIPLTGLAQVGMSGLSKVQYWLHPEGGKLPSEEEDPFFATAPWRDAEILDPPVENWGGELTDAKLPAKTRFFSEETGKPETWPLRYTITHWAALLNDVKPGKYDLRCRTIDANGIAQPMPRPFKKSGRNSIQRVTIVVEA